MYINFDAGPAMMPQKVLEEASLAIKQYKHSGQSILEIPHRGKFFSDILEESIYLVLKITQLNQDFYPIWMQGGGRLQFAMLPMNFLNQQSCAGYVDSGHWAAEAARNATFYGKAKIIASSKQDNYNRLPIFEEEIVPKDIRYLHITTNNTIYGTQYTQFPSIEMPLVADMSSDIFSRRLDFSQFSYIYAVGQKNIGMAGVTLGIIRKDFLEQQNPNIPDILSYHAYVKNSSLINTPPVFAIYCSLLMLRHIDQIGIDQIEKDNQTKAQMLYKTIDNSRSFYTIAQADRSLMNVCFAMKRKEYENKFITFAKERNLIGINGHRSIGGFRASLYNAVSINDVQLLVDAINEFDKIVHS